MTKTRVWVVAVLGAGMAVITLAQESRGTILGRVTDPTGAMIPSVEVRVTNVATGAAASTRTNSSGNYTIPFLLPGIYTLTAELVGFKTFRRDGIQVRVNDSLEVNVEMTVGDVAERIEVTAATPLLETTTASLGQVVDERRMTELPVQAGNPFELVLLAPGVTNATNLRLRKAGWNNAPSQIMTDGNPQYSNEFTIDGVTNTFSSGTTPRVAFSPPQTAVTEIKVQTATYDASLGHTPGSVINASTKAGTNQVRGELHYWLSNSALDAPDFFQNRAGQRRPVYQDNRYGASAGGPVYLPRTYDGRNKTFFFYAWEANKWGVPGTWIGTVPQPAQLNGDLSPLLALGSNYQIYDPATIKPAPGGRFSREPFPGNIVPASRINSLAKNIGRYWPAPTEAGTRDGRNNYSTPTKALEDYYVHLVRLDHNFSQNHRTFLRLHYDWWEEEKNNHYHNAYEGIFLNRINRGLAIDDVLVLRPTMVLNLRYGLTQQEFPERRRSRGFDLTSLGFSPAVTSLADKSLATFPNLSVDGYSAFSGWESGDGANTGLIHSLVTAFTQLRGNHSFRYGADLRLYREFGARFPCDISPCLTFGSGYTRGPLDNSPAAPIGQGLAMFLLGIPDGGSMRRTASYAEQDQFYALYLHDDWKAGAKVTVNLGLRYEYESPLTERFDRSVKGFAFGVSNPIEAAAKASYARSPIPELAPADFRVLGGLTFAGGASGRQLWQGEKNNLMPRIGLAYALTPKTVLRTGYGIFFESIGSNRSSVIQTGFSQSTPVQATRDNGQTFLVTFANPFPEGLREPLGAAGGLTTNLGQGLSFFRGRRRQPYSQRWSIGLQRQLPLGYVAQVAYVGNRGTRADVGRALNATPGRYYSTLPERDQATIDYLSQQVPSPFYGIDPIYGRNTSRAALLRAYPHFSGVSMSESIGYSWYHSLQVSGERRFSQRHTLQFAYTWSKLMEATEFLNDFDAALYESISGFDRTHRLSVSGIFELPFGRGRRFGSSLSAVLDGILGGWQLNTVVNRQSGSPLGFGNVIFRGNLKDIPLPKGQRTVERWFNIDAGFERDSRKQLSYNIRSAPLRYSGIRGDGQARWDISAIKYFPIRERTTLQFRAEAYNAWNHANFNNPNTSVTSSAFGTVTGVSPLPRQFQLALKLTF
ncbi:MAG: carboxypeptidase regulatory-like domain-containing protein [Acidobacteria bacterium]|nr:carboxypeptidase regulatory-like domain-containing protein [Acidobacteriota bacterium]